MAWCLREQVIHIHRRADGSTSLGQGRRRVEKQDSFQSQHLSSRLSLIRSLSLIRVLNGRRCGGVRRRSPPLSLRTCVPSARTNKQSCSPPLLLANFPRTSLLKSTFNPCLLLQTHADFPAERRAELHDQRQPTPPRTLRTTPVVQL